MGTRVYFSYGSKDGALGHFLAAPLESFRAWLPTQRYTYDYDEDSEEVCFDLEPEVLPILDDVLERGTVALIPETLEQARLIDLLICYFYYWCDRKNPQLIVEAVAAIYIRNYRDAYPDVQEYFGEEAGRLWQYILKGRPLGRPEGLFPYTPMEKIFPKSYWTFDEVGFLYYRIAPYQNDLLNLFGKEATNAVGSAFRALEDAFKKGVGLIIEVA